MTVNLARQGDCNVLACADGDSHQPFSVDLEEYAHHQIDRLEIAIERQRADGSWTEVGSTISTFGS